MPVPIFPVHPRQPIVIVVFPEGGAPFWRVVKARDIHGLPPGFIPALHEAMPLASRLQVVHLSQRVGGIMRILGPCRVFGRASPCKLSVYFHAFVRSPDDELPILVVPCCDTLLALAESAISMWKLLIRWAGYTPEDAYVVVARHLNEPLYLNLA